MLSPTLDTYAYQCGFLSHIQRTNKTHKQIRLSAYVFFCVRKDIFQFFFIRNATNSPFVSGLSTKGDNRARLTSFHDKKGGEK